jgi:hypothetical protein
MEMERDGQFLVINIQWEISWPWQGTASNFDSITSSRTPGSSSENLGIWAVLYVR